MVSVFKLVSSVLGCQGLEPCSSDYRRVGIVVASVSFVMTYVSVCLSVRTYQRGFHCTGFREI